jgi:AraC-like DNA-binding protein
VNTAAAKSKRFMDELRPNERIWFSAPSSVPGFEMLHARGCPRLWRVWHETYTLCICYRCPAGSAQGGCDWEYRGKSFSLKPGEVMLLEPGECHITRKLIGNSDFDVFEIDKSIVDSIATERSYPLPVHLRAAWSDDPQLFRACESLALAMYLRLGAIDLQLRITALIGLLLCRYGERGSAPQLGLTKVELKRACDFIVGQHAEDFDLDALARACGASKSAICHGLRDRVGLPPMELRNLVRAARARRLLAAGSTLSEVAGIAGYYDQAQLTRHFRALWGITPGRYVRTRRATRA